MQARERQRINVRRAESAITALANKRNMPHPMNREDRKEMLRHQAREIMQRRRARR